MNSAARRRWSLIAGIMLSPFVTNSCATDGIASAEGAALASINVSASVIGTPVKTLVIEVSAPNINPTLVFNLDVLNGIASGTLKLPPGNARLVSGKAYDSRGDVTHEGNITIEVRPGVNPPISLNLLPRPGQVPITIRLGAPTITIHTPGTEQVTVGNALALTATLTGPDGSSVTGLVEWGTVNPTVATVNAAGVVTGVWEGSTLIVATFAGSAATVNVTVPSCVQAYTIPSSVSATLAAGDCRRQSNGFFFTSGDQNTGQLMDIYGAATTSQRSLLVSMDGQGSVDAYAVQDNVARSVASFNDQNGVGFNDAQYHVIMAPGSYLFAASAWNSVNNGNYTFSTADVSEEITGCAVDFSGIPNQWVTSGIETNQDLSETDCGGTGTGPVIDRISYSAVKNQVVTITVRSNILQVQLTIDPPGTGANTIVPGTFSAGVWTASSTFVAGSTGTFIVSVSTNGSNHVFGPYSLEVE